MSDAKRRDVHEAIQAWLDEDEIAIAWCLVVDVAGPDSTRYLAHRGGGGGDGDDPPMAWSALGMLEASVAIAKEQVIEATEDVDEPEDGEDT